MVNCSVIFLCLLGLVGAITAARIVKVEELFAVVSQSEDDPGVKLGAAPYPVDLADLDLGDLDLGDLLQGCSQGRCEFCTTKVVKACVVATLLSGGAGFDIALTINGVTVFHREVKVADPPPFCVKNIGKMVSDLCLTVYDINLKELSACTKVSFEIKIGLIHEKVAFKIGCFKIPTTDDNNVTDGAISAEDTAAENGRYNMILL